MRALGTFASSSIAASCCAAAENSLSDGIFSSAARAATSSAATVTAVSCPSTSLAALVAATAWRHGLKLLLARLSTTGV